MERRVSSAQVTTVHPLQTGQWSRPIMASVDGPGGTVTLVGTVVFEAVGPAESRVRVESAVDASGMELLAWRLVSRKATRRARESLSGMVTTPDSVRADVARTLADPFECVSQVAALQQIGSDVAVELLVNSQDEIASTWCRWRCRWWPTPTTATCGVSGSVAPGIGPHQSTGVAFDVLVDVGPCHPISPLCGRDFTEQEIASMLRMPLRADRLRCP